MCFAFDARPPALPADLVRAPMAGGGGAELLELESADGARFCAALAESPAADGVGVVILPDVRGLYPFYIELAERFAQAGHHAIAIDYFGRTAGLGQRGEDFEYMPHVMELKVEQVHVDIGAALGRCGNVPAWSESRPSASASAAWSHFWPTPTIGSGSWRAVGFYAALDGSRFGIDGPLQRAADIAGPILGLFGGADQAIPVEQVEQFDTALTAAGVEHEIHVYPGAPHSFFDRRYEDYAEACEDAWRRMLGFLSADR